MRALLSKDLMILKKQFGIFFIIFLAFSANTNFFISSFTIVFCAMLPRTALAYDEICKWTELVKMMPYSNKEIILSKYLLGYITVAGAILISIIMQLILGNLSDYTILLIIIVNFCLANIFQAISMPLMFKFGVEKGRLYLFFVTAIIFATIFTINNNFNLIISSYLNKLNIFVISLFFITVLLNFVSILCSIKLYSSKNN